MDRRDFLTGIVAGGCGTSLTTPASAPRNPRSPPSIHPSRVHTDFERDDWVPHHTLDITEDGTAMLSISLEGPNPPSTVGLNKRRATVLEVVDGEDALSRQHNSFSWDVDRAASVGFRMQLGDSSGRGLETGRFENSLASDLNELVQVNTWPSGPGSLPEAYRFTFDPPTGWSVVSPGERVAPNTYDINPGIIQYGSSLTDLFAVGEFDVHERAAGETSIRYAQLPEGDHPYEIAEALDLLVDATPVIEATYGPNVRHPWAAIFVPSDLIRGGFIKDHSIFYGDDDPLVGDGGSTCTLELGGLYTRAIRCSSKQCSEWYIAGAKSWVGRLYALYATDRIDHEELRRMLRAWLRGSNDARDHEDPLGVPVSDSPVTKGTAINVLLDVEIRARTDGEHDLGAWLREISDQRILQYRGEGQALISDEEARPLLYEITGVDYTKFYERIVHGNEFPEDFVAEQFSIENPWPVYAAFDYSNLELPDGEVRVEEPVEVTVEMRNEADRPQERTVDLVVDGDGVATTPVQLDPGAVTTVTLEHTFTSAGKYDVWVPPVGRETISVTEPENPDVATAPGPASATETAGQESESTISTEGPGFGVGTALIALGIGIGHRLTDRLEDD